MDFLPEHILQYAEKHSQEESTLLKELNRYTKANVMMPRMLSGHLQGRVLSMFSNMVRPKYILEIGTYTGYSSICLAEGLAEQGQLISIDINEELEDLVRSFFQKAGLAEKIQYIIGNALQVIPTLDMVFDLVFIDADKENYAKYYDLVFEKVRPGGFIIADNVLWSGKVADPDLKKMDKDTMAMMDFNKKIQEDTRISNVLFPIRDGLMVMHKI